MVFLDMMKICTFDGLDGLPCLACFECGGCCGNGDLIRILVLPSSIHSTRPTAAVCHRESALLSTSSLVLPQSAAATTTSSLQSKSPPRCQEEKGRAPARTLGGGLTPYTIEEIGVREHRQYRIKALPLFTSRLRFQAKHYWLARFNKFSRALLASSCVGVAAILISYGGYIYTFNCADDLDR